MSTRAEPKPLIFDIIDTRVDRLWVMQKNVARFPYFGLEIPLTIIENTLKELRFFGHHLVVVLSPVQQNPSDFLGTKVFSIGFDHVT